ncbi:hypothetical protein [Tritonibacter mobilis]|uniref:hypothetical protein n=1 Tax=Tritonibacter mobilis TaxID=379347 RepID=UPI00089C8F0C|nr:hypothetical protein [Tritonibacter mobilis]GLP86266.1 hypothetical protein GCM10007921_18260 [Tritonibacter mobilis]SDX17494.1 hypothetical protein SAMN05444385_105195 [Tritonibacter mobilis]
MKTPHRNKTNPCARVLADMARTCFLIGEETDFDAHFRWSAHVNEVEVTVTPANASLDHAVLQLDEYLNIPSRGGRWSENEFRTDTYPRVKAFAKELEAFYLAHQA